MNIGIGIQINTGSTSYLSAEARAYKTRVEADGGVVQNIRMVDELLRDAAKNGYSSELIGWSARWGYKADSMGRVSKLYSLAGAGSDLIQATVAKQPHLFPDSVNGNNTIVFNGKNISATAADIKAVNFTLNQPETIIFGMFNSLLWRVNSTFFDGSVINAMRVCHVAPTPTIQQFSTSLGVVTAQLTSGLKTPFRALFNGAASKIKIGSNTELSSTIGTAAGGGFVLGSNPSESGNAYMHVSDVIVLTSAVDGSYPAKRDAVEIVLAKYNTSLSIAPPAIKFDGNSMTSGIGSTTDNDYPSQVYKTIGRTITPYNYGVPSRTLVTAITDAISVTGISKMAGAVNQGNVVVVWDGTNDLYGGATGATTFTNLLTYCAARRAEGDKLVVVTMLPRSNAGTPGGFEAERQVFNSAVRADGLVHFDVIADVALDNRIGDAGDELDTVYYPDKVHMTDAGYGIVASIVKTAILSLI